MFFGRAGVDPGPALAKAHLRIPVWAADRVATTPSRGGLAVIGARLIGKSPHAPATWKKMAEQIRSPSPILLPEEQAAGGP